MGHLTRVISNSPTLLLSFTVELLQLSETLHAVLHHLTVVVVVFNVITHTITIKS